MARNGVMIEKCGCSVIHEDIVRKVKKLLPREGDLFELAELFKVFGDSTRVRIISSLLHSPMCVCDIAVLLGMSKSAISHQLRVLRQAKLVKYRREGKVVFYSLDDSHVASIFKQALTHINEDKKSGVRISE